MESFIAYKDCEKYRKECKDNCERYKEGVCKDMEKLRDESTLNTQFRISSAHLIKIFLGAMITGFVGVIFAILVK